MKIVCDFSFFPQLSEFVRSEINKEFPSLEICDDLPIDTSIYLSFQPITQNLLLHDSFSPIQIAIRVPDCSFSTLNCVRIWKETKSKLIRKLDPTKRIRLIALDMDGTSLNSKHKFSFRTRQYLRNLSIQSSQLDDPNSLRICFATGRSSGSVIQYIQSLSLSQSSVPVIAFNGSRALLCPCPFPSSTSPSTLLSTEDDVDSDEIDSSFLSSFPAPSLVFAHSLSLSSTQLFLQFCDEQGVGCQYYNGESGEVSAVPKGEGHIQCLERYATLVGKKQTLIPCYSQLTSQYLPAKLLLFCSDEMRIREIEREARSRFPPSIFHIILGSPFPFFLEFLPPEVNKGRSLMELCNQLNIPPENVLSFGDGENDIEMLQLSGVGVAMGNAKEVVKEAADVVLGLTNDEDGVVEWVERAQREGLLWI